MNKEYGDVCPSCLMTLKESSRAREWRQTLEETVTKIIQEVGDAADFLYYREARPLERFQDAKAAKAGIINLMCKGIPIFFGNLSDEQRVELGNPRIFPVKDPTP